MADLLGSILGKMEKPPSLGVEERKKAKERQKQVEKIKEHEKQRLQVFRRKVQKVINDFIKDSKAEKYKFEPEDAVLRSVIHEVADIAGLVSFSFGMEEEDRYVMIWKKEFAPCDDELLAYRKGEEWDPLQGKAQAQISEDEDTGEKGPASEKVSMQPSYREKYEKIFERAAANEAAQATSANRCYGYVPSENKRDQRTIEQVMADNRAKRQKTNHYTNRDPPPDVASDSPSSDKHQAPADTDKNQVPS